MRKASSFFTPLVAVFVIVFALVSVTGCGKKKEEAVKGIETSKTSEKTTATSETAAGKENVPPPAPSSKPITEERVFYNFETDLEGWEIPAWAEGKPEYVAKSVIVSKDVAVKGSSSMKVDVDCPGTEWTAGLVEIQQYLNLSPYRVVSADIYIPKDAPVGLKAKLILTVGDNWKFVEMSRSIPLVPGEWATVTASIEPGSYDWKRVVPNEQFAEDVRKIAIRIESNRKPAYKGPVYIDNIRVGR